MSAYEELRHAAETAVADLQAGMRDAGFIVRYLKRALKTPRRNCDVGTAEEQMERHYMFCSKNKECHPDSSRCMMCYAKWAQMPYEEGGEK